MTLISRLDRTSWLRFAALCVAVAAVVALTSPAHGQITWTGGGGNNEFSNAGNWNPGVPTDPVADMIIFGLDGGDYQVDNANGTLTDIMGIQFDGAMGSYTIDGSGVFQLTTGTSVLNNSTFTQTINVTLMGTNNMGGPGTLTLNADTGSLIVNDIDLSDAAGVELTVTGADGQTVTINGVISGGALANLVKSGAGTLVLNNANTYGGSTALQSGIVVVGNDAAFSTSLVQITGDTQLQSSDDARRLTNTIGIDVSDTLTVSGTNDLELAGTVTGLGNLLVNMSDARLILTGSNSHAATELAQGTIVLGHDNALGSGALTVSGNASIDSDNDARSVANDLVLNSGVNMTFVGTEDLSLLGVISGNGGIIKNGAMSTLTLGGTNTFLGQTMVMEGTVRVEGGDAINDNAGVFVANAMGATFQLGADETVRRLNGGGATGGLVDLQGNTLTIDENLVSAYGGKITGAGSIVYSGTGLYTLSGDNDYTGGTTVNGAGGTLTLGSDTALGAGALNIDADMTISGDDGDRTIANDINVNSDFNIGGTDALTFTGNVALPGDAEFEIGTVSSADFAGVISGAGGVMKAGLGTLTLSGVNTYTGDTDINAGTLKLMGSVAGNIDVNDTGTLIGTGTVTGNLTNFSGGTVNPGDGEGTLNVTGNYDQQAGSTLAVDLNAQNTTSDLLNVTGTATLADDSTIQANIASPMFIQGGQTFTVLQAAGGITDNGVDIMTNSATMTFIIQGQATFQNGDTSFVLEAVRAAGVYETVAVGANNQAIGSSLNSLVDVANADPNGLAADLLGRLDPLNATDFNQAVMQMSPEPINAITTAETEALGAFTSTQAEYLASKRVGANALAMQAALETGMLASAVNNPTLLQQAIAEQDEAFEESFTANPLGAYLRGFGVFTNQDPLPNQSGFDADTFGAQAGIDYTFSESFLAGIAFAYSTTDVTLDGGAGDFEIDSFRVGPYYTESGNGWHLDVSVTAGFTSYESRRNISTLGLTAAADYDGWDVTAFIGGGYEFQIDNAWVLTPTASLLYSHFEYDGYRETGAAGANLQVGDRDTDSLRGRFGAALTHRFDDGHAPTFFDVFLGWEHEFLDADDVQSTFVAGGNPFSVDTGDREDDGFFFGTGLTRIMSDRLSVFVRYEGLFSDASTVHAVTGGVTVRF